MAAMPVAGAMAAPVVAADPHVEWWHQHEELERRRQVLSRRFRTLPEDGAECIRLDEAMQAMCEEQWELEKLIAETPAATLDGLLAQAMVAQIGLVWDPGDPHRDAIANLIAGLKRMPGVEPLASYTGLSDAT
jgi:hypothetical protein